ncbi:MAG: hypothetical protein MMC33_003296 [Icmadophila ericetorum]|nr:hypothetical protein [Icmadophila ericetorum]
MAAVASPVSYLNTSRVQLSGDPSATDSPGFVYPEGTAQNTGDNVSGLANAVPPPANQLHTTETPSVPQAATATTTVEPDANDTPNQQVATEVTPTDPENTQTSSAVPEIDVASSLQQVPNDIPSQQEAAPLPSSEYLMHLTALGAHILSSSVNPAAALDPPHETLLTTVREVPTPGTGPDAQQDLPVPIISIANSVAPSDQPHSKVWATALQAAQSGHDLVVNGEKLENPGLASVDGNGNIVKIALAQVVSSTSGASIEVTKTSIGPVIPATSDVTPDVLANAPVTDVEIPPALTVHQGDDGSVHPSITTPPGFVLTGSTKLFNILEAERFVFQGTSSSDGKSEMIVPTTSPLSLDQLIHDKDIPLGDIQLVNPSISHYPQKTDAGRGPGLYLDATIDLIGDLAEIGNDLKSVFGHTAEGIKISASLGGFESWSAALKPPPDFTFEASIPSLNATLGKFITFASVDITFQAVRTPDPADANKQVYAWAHLFTGQLNMTTPGSITPLSLDFSLTRQGTVCSLDMHLHESQTWNNAMGVPGLHLFDIHFSTQFDKTATGTSHTFNFEATLKAESTDLKVTGTYQDDKWSMNATLEEVGWTQLDDLYMELFGARLHKFDHNIAFQDLQLDISSETKDLVLQGHLNLDDWAHLAAKVTISTSGFQLEASVDKATLEHVTLEDAKIDIFVGKQGDVDASAEKPGTAASFTMTGSIEAAGLKLDATAYLDKDPKLGLLWVVYAKCSDIHLSKVLGLGSRGDLDMVLENVALMAANTSTVGPYMPTLDYQIKPGFQLMAKIDTPRALAKSLHSSPSGLLVEMDLSKNCKSIDFLFSGEQTMSLKPGVSAPTIKAGIIVEEEPTLFIAADLAVMLNDQPTPLIFELRLDANLLEANATASLTTDWPNPFGISPQVKVLAPVTLGVKIIYASEFYPSGLSFEGGIQVGKTTLHAAFDITDNPKEGVIQVEADNLGITDIISFVSLVTGRSLPQPSTDFFEFEQLKFGLSTGANIRDVYYPPGVTFSAKMIIFNKTASLSAAIVKDPPSLTASGSIEAFSLGPLTVSGYTNKDLSFDLAFAEGQQHFALDGQIRLWDLDIAITIHADLHPLTLDFTAELDFSDALKFMLSAHIVGEVHSLKDLANCDFTFEADMEQHILDYVMAHANSYILAAKKASDEGIDAAKAKLEEAEKAFNDIINKKQVELDAKKAAWDKQNAATIAAVNAKKAKVQGDEAEKRKAVDDAKKKLDAFIDDLTKKLDKTRNDAKQEIDKAEKTLNEEKKRIDRDVDNKVKEVHKAQDALSHSFGNADKALSDAQQKVDAAQRDVDNANRDLENAKRDLSHANFFNKIKYAFIVAGRGTEKTAKEAALAVAHGILSAARAVVDGPAHKIASGAVTLAEKVLEDAKKVGDGVLNGLRATLEETKKVQNGLIAKAEVELQAAKKECNQSKAWDVAKATLKAFMDAEAAIVTDAEKALVALESCGEKLAYEAALAALNIARAGTKEIDLARHAVQLVEDGVDGMADLGTWMVSHVGNIFNIRSLKLSGSLGKSMMKTPLVCAIEGVFAEKEVKFEVDFVPGKAEEMMKKAFEKILAELKGDLGGLVKKIL